jgi:outer membrane protein TolC
MHVKHRSKQHRRYQIVRALVAIAAAPIFVIASHAQNPSPRTTTPNTINGSINRQLPDSLIPRPPRPTTATPLDIERQLGSAAGSLATIKRSTAKTTAAPPSPFSSPLSLGTPATTAGHHLSQQSIQQHHVAPVNVPPPISHGPFGGQLDVYSARAYELPDAPPQDNSRSGSQAGFDMWWKDAMSAPLGLSDEALPVDIAGLTETALVSSPYIQGILTEPEIRRSDVVIADADFDSLAFIEAKFADTNEPQGDVLQTGNANIKRFLDRTFSSAAGLRKKSRYGGSLEVVQRGGFQDNNSEFLNPNPQGTTRLEINFTQPLLKDHGRAVNNTRVLLAQIDVQLATSEVRGDLENHLVDVTRSYWELFQARAEWLQRNRLLEGATKLSDILEARGDVDSLQRQILRAQVAVTSRRSDLVRAETRIRNAQARLRVLTGDPRLIQASRWELTPQDQPLAFPVQLSTRGATITALDNRADVAQAIRKIQAVSARVGAARNQVLPRLDMILSTYVAGLENKTDTFGAWANQVRDGRPSYAAGLQFEIPVGNRASRARLARNRWELTRSLFEFQQTTEVAFAEVEIAVRETHTAFDEMVTKKQAIDAASREVSYLQQRWELLPDPNESAVLLIENLLDAQERRADEERAFTRAQVDYAMSWVKLRQATGVLLRFENPSHSPLIAENGAGLSQPSDSRLGQSSHHAAGDSSANSRPAERGGTSLR